MGARGSLWLLLPALALAQPGAVQPDARTEFHVKQVVTGAIYIDGGTSSGLAEGMRLRVSRRTPGAATLTAEQLGEVLVVSVASTSALCEAVSGKPAFAAGDTAELSTEDAQLRQILKGVTKQRNFAQLVSFGEDDPIEDELREHVPRPPLPEVNRIRGRISYENNILRDHSGGGTSNQQGLALRADMTRLGGSFWNFTGYWRGRRNVQGRGPDQTTLVDLMNRTYHIGFYYSSPRSNNVVGLGRLLLPWAASLNTIDGGYFGRRLNRTLTAAVFAGSTPDPTAWNYAPGRMLAGALVNFEKGRFDALRFSSTTGIAFSSVHWKPERRFIFAENSLFWKNLFSVYQNLEADQMKAGRFGNTVGGPALTRSFTTLRLQPIKWVSFDLNHNYLRSIPTFDPRLISTGLVDKWLFQGLSAGIRVQGPRQLVFSAQYGRNKRDQDARAALNYMYGVSWTRVPWVGMRADFRYARVNSSFGSGGYQSASLTKELGERLRLEFQAGQQSFASQLTRQNRTRHAGASIDWLLGRHIFLGGGGLFYRGPVQSYDQLFVNLGYRF
jgi:hypothetical protein